MARARCPDCGAVVKRGRLRAHRERLHAVRGRGLPGRGRKRQDLFLATMAVLFAAIALLAVYIQLDPRAGPTEGGREGPTDHDAVDISFHTADGFELRGTFFKGSPSAPLIILVHGLNEDRHGYDALVPELRALKYNVLAYDSRGHGLSVHQNGRYRDRTSFSQVDFQATVLDIAAAKNYALASFDSAPYLAVVGASLGANAALNYTATPEGAAVNSLVLLSPGSDYQGLPSGPAARAVSARGGTAVLFAAGEEDSYSSSCARDLFSTFASKKQLEIQPGQTHGTNLLADPAFRQKVIAFLGETLA